MITNQYVLSGSRGTYPIFDFTLEDNYERPSSLIVKTDPKLADSISSETYMQFYYLDNKLFEGIPVFGRKINDQFELTLYDKTASLWTVGGFALSDASATVSYTDVSAYEIASALLKGSQFHVTTQSVPATKVSVSGNWQTKTDIFYAIAKQIIDQYGNTSTVWIDDNNCVWIGGLNSDKTIDLSTKIVDVTNQDINYIKYGGVVVKGGKTAIGNDIYGTSMNDVRYSNYDLTNKSIGNFNVIHTPASVLSTIAFNTVGNHKEIKIGFNKASTPPATMWHGDPLVNDVVNGYYYNNSVVLRDNDSSFDYNEVDLAARVWFDSSSNLNVDNWIPTTYIESTYPKHAGMPYTYLKGVSVGFMDASNNPVIEATIEKYAAGIYLYASSQYSTRGYYISDIGVFRIYLNMNNYSKSIKTPNFSGYNQTTLIPTPFEIPYWNNKDCQFLIRFKSRASGWSLQVIMETQGSTPGTLWYNITNAANNFNITNKWKVDGAGSWPAVNNGLPPTPTVNYLFNGSNTFPDGSLAATLIGGGYPFIRAYLKTNIEPSRTNDAVYVSQIFNGSTNVPMVVGMPIKTIAHKPYLFYSDASIKHESQAKSYAQNIHSDYQKMLSADIEIEPSTFYYPSDNNNRFKSGWNVTLDEPCSIIGNFKIRSITATPDKVTVSLKNRSLAMSDVIDKIQKQLKDVV